MGFTSDLELRQISDERWELTADLVYQHAPGNTITATAGFSTDLATVPHVFRWLVGRSGRDSKAAVIHDWLLATNLPRCQADAIFRDALRDLNLPWLRRWLMWGAVRLFRRPCSVLEVVQLMLLLILTFPFWAAGFPLAVLLVLFWLLEVAAVVVRGGKVPPFRWW